MSDFTAKLYQTLIVGQSGSGKSSFAIVMLLNWLAACRFIFDDTGQMAARLRKPHASTARELELALATRWVVFNPHRMFPGQLDAGFEFFCQWVFDACKRGPGEKLVLIDEFWRFCSPNYISPQFATLAQMGRVEGIHLVIATQTPQKANSSIVGQTTELVCYRLQGHLALKSIDQIGIGADIEAVSKLPPYHFISYHNSGCQLAGQAPF